MENVKLLESLVSRNFVYLYIYSFDCIVVAKPFWFILRINIVHTVILTFLWQISYIPCLYIVYVTRLAIFVAKKSKLLYLLLQYIVCWNYWSIWCYVTFLFRYFSVWRFCLELNQVWDRIFRSIYQRCSCIKIRFLERIVGIRYRCINMFVY